MHRCGPFLHAGVDQQQRTGLLQWTSYCCGQSRIVFLCVPVCTPHLKHQHCLPPTAHVPQDISEASTVPADPTSRAFRYCVTHLSRPPTSEPQQAYSYKYTETFSRVLASYKSSSVDKIPDPLEFIASRHHGRHLHKHSNTP